MASPVDLLDFPNELLDEVISYLEHEFRTLRGLSGVSRRFNALTKKYLCRYTDGLCIRRQQLLKRTLEQSPELRPAVWTYGIIPIDTTGNISSDDFELISSFNKLKSIHVKVCRGLSVKPLCRRRLFHSQVFNTVEDVVLTIEEPWQYQGLSLLVLQPLVQMIVQFLPGIKTLIVTNDSRTFDALKGLLKPENVASLYKNALTTIQLFPGTPTAARITSFIWPDRPVERLPAFSAHDFANLIRNCTNITNLRCLNLFIDKNNDVLPRTLVNPNAIVPALQPISNSLRYLCLATTKLGAWSAPRTPLLDLSGFASLLDLVIDAGYMLPFNASTIEKGNLYLRLPPQLETLHMDFDMPSGVLGPGIPAETVGYPAFACQWLFQFANHKARYFARLDYVELFDKAGDHTCCAMGPITTCSACLDEDDPYVRHDWNVPDTLKKRLVEAGIHMDVLLMARRST